MPPPVIRFYTTTQLGDNQSLTPEGYLLCTSVPLCRTGSQMYAHGEIPVEPDQRGLIRIERTEDEVFRPETIASFNGKPVVDEHPPEGKITPDIWRAKSMGVVLNPRRGDGLQYDSQFMFADLLLTDPEAIIAVRGGKREVSCGYDAEYQSTTPGYGRQRNIIGNHVALVDKGRCGPLCAIGDSAHTTGDSEMPANRVKFFRDKIRKAVRTNDESGVLNAVAELSKDPDLMGEVISGDDMPMPESNDVQGHHVTINVHSPKKGAMDEEDPAPGVPPADPAAAADPGGGDVASQLAALNARMDQVEQVLAMLADAEEAEAPADPDVEAADPSPEEAPDDEDKKFGDNAMTGDKRATVGDSTSLRDGFQFMLSQAEILMPGIQLMTFDAASPAKSTFDAMCSFRRKTLEASKGTEKGKAAIDSVMGGAVPKSFHDKTMTCDAVSHVFNGAAALMAVQNRGIATQPHFGPNGQRNGFSTGKALTPAEINKMNAAKYGLAH